MTYHYRKFKETDAYLGNPHKGCCTFQHFNGDPLFPGTSWSEYGPEEFPPPASRDILSIGGKEPVKTIPGYLPSTVAYCRWFWQTMEPQKGEYRWDIIDKALETAASRSQTLTVRLMPFGSIDQAGLPEWYAKSYACETKKVGSRTWLRPDHDSEDYFTHWGGFIKKFAERYDSHPLLETIDIAFIGAWGEGAGECCNEQVERFVALWRNSFKETYIISLIAGYQLEQGVKNGAGWRADCFGDSRFTNFENYSIKDGWNHMYDCYPKAVFQSGATDAWKTAPIHLETCHVPQNWLEFGGDIDFIIQQGLKYHATYFMPKYTKLPDVWMEKLAGFTRKLGYRFVLRTVKIEDELKYGEPLPFEAWIENVGVAPLYQKKYNFVMRFTQGGQSENVTIDSKPHQWMPGDTWIETSIKIPAWLKPGMFQTSLGITDGSDEVKIRFAVEERTINNYVPLDKIELKE